MSAPRSRLRAVSIATLITTLTALVLAANGHAALAADVIFTIDPAQSSTTWSGSDDLFGAFAEQSAGSLSASLSGHFLVKFDPVSGTPATLQFVLGHGYYQAASPHAGLPGVGGSGPAAPANFAGKTASAEVNWAIRDLVWDFGSGEISAGAPGVFDATQTSFTVLSGSLDFSDSDDGSGSIPYTGATDPLTGGTWTLSESSPGNGDWTLDFEGSYDYVHTIPGTIGATFGVTGTTLATAQFGAGNIDSVTDSDTDADALGGSGAIGGVSAEFSNPTSGGVFTAQQIPNETGLSQAAVAAAAANPIFALSTDTLSANPQIWNVDFSGDLDGASVTLVFHYDPSLLPVGLDELTLGIWHFNSNTDSWDFGGIVDPDADTITFVTDNFSPFEMGVIVPEPSTLMLAGVGLMGVAWCAWRRRKSRR